MIRQFISFFLLMLAASAGATAAEMPVNKASLLIHAQLLTPVITASGTLPAVTTIYGVTSAVDSFLVTGTALQMGITVSAPTGFEVSTSHYSTYTSRLTAGAAGNSSTWIFIRLAALTPASGTAYTGSAVLSSRGATTVNSPSISGTVNRRAITLILYDIPKNYGDTSWTYLASAYIPTGANGEVITGAIVTPDSIGDSGSAPAGSAYTEVLSGAIGSGGFNVSNYAITYVNYSAKIAREPVEIYAGTISKVYGTVLTNEVSSPYFTSSGLRNLQTINSVSITYSNGAAASAQVATYTGSVSASNASGGTYNPSNYSLTYFVGNLVVTPAPLTITADTLSKVYGSVLNTPVNSTLFTDSGLVNSDTLNSVQLTYGKGAADTSQVGLYNASILPGNASGTHFNKANYSINYVAATLMVTPVPLTLTADSSSKVYGTALITQLNSIRFTATGLKNKDSITSVTLNYGSGSASSDSVGSYIGSIQASAPAGSHFNIKNYTVNTVTSTLTVTPAPLIITADTASKTYGIVLVNQASSQRFTVKGLVNSEQISPLPLQYLTGGAATDTAGIYPEAVSAGPFSATAAGNSTPAPTSVNEANAHNYKISYVTAPVIITPALLAITADSISKIYGTALTTQLNSIKFTASGLKNKDNIATVTLNYGSGKASSDSVGSYIGSIQASSPAGSHFNIKNYTVNTVTATLTVTPAALSITADSIIRTYGAVSGSSKQAKFTEVGLVAGDTLTVVPILTVSGTRGTQGAGTYPGSVNVRAVSGPAFNPGNYVINYTSGSLIILPAPLTITADSTNKTYGSALINQASSQNFTVTGLVYGDVIAALPVLYSAGAAATDPAGTYSGAAKTGPLTTATTANSGNNASSASPANHANPGNYSITYVAGPVIIARHFLLVTPDSVDKVYGVALVPVTKASGFTVSGLQNTETAGTMNFKYGAGALLADLSGTYSGSVSGSNLSGGSFSASNYSLIYNTASIRVGTPKPLVTITSQPDFNTSTGSFTIANYNRGYTYTLYSASGSGTIAGSVITAVPGSYTLTALAPHSFTSPVSETIVIDAQPSSPVLIITNPVPVTAPGFVNLTAPAITAKSDSGLTYAYFIDSLATVVLQDPADITTSGTYYIKATNAGTGAFTIKEVTVVINSLSATAFFIPNVITPNGDGKNDRFVVTGLELFPGSSLRIFNRWGNRVYTSANYLNTWDGSGLASGVYYYVLQVNRGTSKPTEYKGWVQLLR